MEIIYQSQRAALFAWNATPALADELKFAADAEVGTILRFAKFVFLLLPF